MSYRNRIKRIQKFIDAKKSEHDDSVLVTVGVCRIDDAGNISGGELKRVPKDQAGAYGVLGTSEPMDRAEWQERAKELNQRQLLEKVEQKFPGLLDALPGTKER